MSHVSLSDQTTEIIEFVIELLALGIAAMKEEGIKKTPIIKFSYIATRIRKPAIFVVPFFSCFLVYLILCVPTEAS